MRKDCEIVSISSACEHSATDFTKVGFFVGRRMRKIIQGRNTDKDRNKKIHSLTILF